MRSFKDKAGNDWDVEVTLGTRQKIIARLKFDFLSNAQSDLQEFIGSLVYDVEKFVNILGILLEAQLKEKGMDLQGICDLIDGPAMDRAQIAAAEAFCDFFQSSRRCHLATALREAMAMMEAAVENVNREIETKARDQMSLTEKSSG